MHCLHAVCAVLALPQADIWLQAMHVLMHNAAALVW